MRTSNSLLALVLVPVLGACADGTSPEDALSIGGGDLSGEGGGGGAGGSLALGMVDGDDTTLSVSSRQPPTAQAIETGAGGSGSTTGSTSGSGGDPNASDTCPGELHAITLDAIPYVVEGDTTGATDAIETCWSVDVADDGADRIYAFDLPSAGVFRVQLDSLTAGYHPVLVVRDVCDQRTDEYCHDTGTTTQVHKAVRGAGRVYVGVDSPGLATGAFSLSVTLVTEGCGDGIVGPTEECDVGTGVANDGCGDPGQLNACLLTAPQNIEGDDCTYDGEGLNVPGGASSITGLILTTNGFGDDTKGTCMPETGGADRVFRLMPQATGNLEVRAGFDDAGANAYCSTDYTAPGCFDVELYARTTCSSEDPLDELACRSDCCSGEIMSFPVVSGEPVYLFVDGYDSEWYSRGPFNLHFDLQTGG